jgi:hypothetical protein
VTPAGKEASRRNALKEGLTAKVLTLPGEDPEQIQARAERWHEAYQPESHDEEALVDQVAIAELRIERLAKAENEIIAEQIRKAETQWTLRQELRLLKLRRLLRRDRTTAILKLRSFGPGVSWLLGRWKVLESEFIASQGWRDLGQIREAVLLRGLHDDRIDARTGSGYEFAFLAMCCVESPETVPGLVEFIASYDDEGGPSIASSKGMKQLLESMASFIPDECLSRRSVRELPATEARHAMRGWIERQIADLRELDRQLREADARSRAGAKVRAMAPADTPRNRLLLRYRKSAESAFDRTTKTLTKLQSAREKGAESEAKREQSEARKTELRNEANLPARSHSKELAPGSCVKIRAKDYVVVEKSDGNLILTQIDATIESRPREVAAAPENGV